MATEVAEHVGDDAVRDVAAGQLHRLTAHDDVARAR